MSDTFSKVEVITGVARRRRFPADLTMLLDRFPLRPGDFPKS
jgi:hypothetical protein